MDEIIKTATDDNTSASNAEKKKRTVQTPEQRIANANALIAKKRKEQEKLQSEIKKLEKQIADIRKKEHDKKLSALGSYLNKKGIDPGDYLRNLIEENNAVKE